MDQKTHTERKTPQISANRLADYMAASEQAAYRILCSCKYRPTARVIQHDDAKNIISTYLCKSMQDTSFLLDAVGKMASRVLDTAFESELNEHNCDYIRRFVDIASKLKLPECQFTLPQSTRPLHINGTTVTFYPDVFVWRTNRRNVMRTGAIVLRYAKGTALPQQTAEFLSSFIFNYLKERPFNEGEPEKKSMYVTRRV